MCCDRPPTAKNKWRLWRYEKGLYAIKTEMQSNIYEEVVYSLLYDKLYNAFSLHIAIVEFGRECTNV